MITPKLYARYLHWRHHRTLEEARWPMDAGTAWRIVQNEVRNQITDRLSPFQDYTFQWGDHHRFCGDATVNIHAHPDNDGDWQEGYCKIEYVIGYPNTRNGQFKVDIERGRNVCVTFDYDEADSCKYYRTLKYGRPQAAAAALASRKSQVDWVQKKLRGSADDSWFVTVMCDEVDFYGDEQVETTEEGTRFVRSCLQSIFDLKKKAAA